MTNTTPRASWTKVTLVGGQQLHSSPRYRESWAGNWILPARCRRPETRPGPAPRPTQRECEVSNALDGDALTRSFAAPFPCTLQINELQDLLGFKKKQHKPGSVFLLGPRALMCWEREGSQWVSWPGEGLSHQQAHMQTQPPSHPLGGRPVDRYHLPPNVKGPGQIGIQRRGKAADFSYNVGRAALQNMRGEGKVWVVRRGGQIRTRWAGGAAPFSTGPSHLE